VLVIGKVNIISDYDQMPAKLFFRRGVEFHELKRDVWSSAMLGQKLCDKLFF
jgi:hypothetical protein